MKTYEFKI